MDLEERRFTGQLVRGRCVHWHCALAALNLSCAAAITEEEGAGFARPHGAPVRGFVLQEAVGEAARTDRQPDTERLIREASFARAR